MNKEEFDYLGITRWHELGYKGQGVTVASKEEIFEGMFDDVEVLHYGADDKWTRHGTTIMDLISQIVPDAHKMAVSTSKSTTTKGVFKCEGLEYLLERKPNILTTSFFQTSDYKSPRRELYKKLYDEGCYLCCAAGNDGNKGVNKIARDDWWKAIGACRLVKEKVVRASFSSIGEELDYMSFDNLAVTWKSGKPDGTSYASPVFASMLALVQCFFILKTGKKLTHEQLDRFIRDNCIDLEKDGRDDNTGYGLFILPDPEEINIYKYSEVKMFKDYTEWKEAIYYLAEKGEMDSPSMWLKRIEYDTDVDLMWFCVKWANAVARA